MSPEFRAAERAQSVRFTCCDCGKPAQGNVSCEDGELCDACDAAQMTDNIAPIIVDDCEERAPDYSWSNRTRGYVDELGHEHGNTCEVCGAADIYSHTPECETEQIKAVQP